MMRKNSANGDKENAWELVSCLNVMAERRVQRKKQRGKLNQTLSIENKEIEPPIPIEKSRGKRRNGKPFGKAVNLRIQLGKKLVKKSQTIVNPPNQNKVNCNSNANANMNSQPSLKRKVSFEAITKNQMGSAISTESHPNKKRKWEGNILLNELQEKTHVHRLRNFP